MSENTPEITIETPELTPPTPQIERIHASTCPSLSKRSTLTYASHKGFRRFVPVGLLP